MPEIGTTMDPQIQQALQALAFFKDWSNALLVTTVAALGWVATKPELMSHRWLHIATLVCFCLSIVAAIGTLALIPIVAEGISKGTPARSFYDVPAKFNVLYLWPPEHQLVLKTVCFWQHVFFLVGILSFTSGSIPKRKYVFDPSSS